MVAPYTLSTATCDACEVLALRVAGLHVGTVAVGNLREEVLAQCLSDDRLGSLIRLPAGIAYLLRLRLGEVFAAALAQQELRDEQRQQRGEVDVKRRPVRVLG